MSDLATSSPKPTGKVRGPGMVILLTIVTLGIYGLFWQYKTFKEMKAYSGVGIGGGLGLLLAIFFAIANSFIMPGEVGDLYAAEGQAKPVRGPTGWWVFLPLVGWFVWVVKVQGALDRFWQEHEGASDPTHGAPGA